MKIGIIGAGKVGITLGKYLTDAGISVTGYYSKTKESADIAATFTKTTSYQTLEDLAQRCDTLFITTPDGVIGQVWQQLQTLNITGYIICHFSGSLSSNIFTGIDRTGAYGGSIHPMYAFCDKFSSYQQFHTAVLTMEGDPVFLEKMHALWSGLGHKVLSLKAEDKVRYHAAAALASNYMLGLMQTSLDLLSTCGFSEEDSMMLLSPLVEGNIAAMLDKGCVEALTGPIERNDIQTVQKHLKALKGTDTEKIYKSLGGKMVSLAKRRNPDRDYSTLQKVFE